MNFDEFVPNAERTESKIETVRLDKGMYRALVSSMLSMSDNLDLIKKNVFYGKPIDRERFSNNIKEVEFQISRGLAPEYIFDNSKANTETSVDPRLFHGCIGAVTEALELLELIDLNERVPPKKDVALETGDLMWYLAILLSSQNINFEEDVLDAVITKLKVRFPEKFESELAINRDKEKENVAVK